jgi:curved DNA-binding protein CbpA
MNYKDLQNSCFKGNGACPKAGIKIHETPSNNNTNPRQNTNTLNSDPDIFRPSTVRTPVNFYQTSLSNLDLELDHYSLEDLYKLFNIPEHQLSEQALKNAKQIVYKMHPDKSQLDPKYFRFFSAAYKRVFSIFEFQNKSLNKRLDTNDDYYDESNKDILNHMFETNKGLKDPKNFNSWFNEKFEKHSSKDDHDQTNKGYGDWLKSDEGLYSVNDNITKANMNDAFEKQKKQIQALTTYQGINDSFSSFSGSLLGDQSDNFTGSNGALGYTDLRQAHVESVIPVTQEDYDRMPKYKSLSEYKARRDTADTSPLSKQEAERVLLRQGQNLEQQSAALAYKYAQQSERARQNSSAFFSDLRQITK